VDEESEDGLYSLSAMFPLLLDMASPRSDVLIIGAGVSGLTTALALTESGVPAASIRVVADSAPEATTSSCAGAIWGPYLSPDDPGTDAWGRYTLDRLRGLAADPDAGVHLVRGVEAGRTHEPPPTWALEVPDYQPCTPDELPDGFVSGWRYTIPVVDMPRYLAYLTKRLEQVGIAVAGGRFASLDEAGTQAGVVVNCAGLGARWLVPDETLRPVRGQLVVTENPGITEFFAEHTEDVSELTYLLPQGDHVVLGGNADDDRAERVADPEVARRIVDRCVEVAPALRGARILGHRVGIRPTRPRIRVERDDTRAVPVVHNYGHGGSGVSLSWGCARDVAAIVNAAFTTGATR
jgi:D-amino-acid oxidase